MADVNEAARAHLACPICFSENRVPARRLGDGPKCGKCGAQLLDGRTVVLDDRTFDAFLKPAGLPVLVDFWAPWCGPCRAMAPTYEQAAQRLATKVRFAKVSTDEAQGLAGRFAIRSIPTLVLFRDGQETKRISGALDLGSLLRWVGV